MDIIPEEELTITKLNKGIDLSDFECKDEDLTGFLKDDALIYLEKNLAITYLCYYQNKVVGFFSLATDSVKLEREEKDDLNKPNLYPAIKIARLATHKDRHKRGIGTFMVKTAIGMILKVSNNVGCRLVTVDSYPESVEFYEKLNFRKNLAFTNRKETVSMRLDLYPFWKTTTK
ncbi:MAG: GNAT family N-acetyltransferase [Candidatus Micrarchaeota archaeon]